MNLHRMCICSATKITKQQKRDSFLVVIRVVSLVSIQFERDKMNNSPLHLRTCYCFAFIEFNAKILQCSSFHFLSTSLFLSALIFGWQFFDASSLACSEMKLYHTHSHTHTIYCSSLPLDNLVCMIIVYHV